MGDINPFTALMSNPCCQRTCDPCPPPPGGAGMQGGMFYGDDGYPAGFLPPEELAAQWAANIWPELYDDLLAIVLEAIAAAPDEATQAYWQAVYDLLNQ
jgi:hypothetical protein